MVNYSWIYRNSFLEIFKSICNPAGNVYVQDSDPSQNFKAALDKIENVQLSIPPCSQDLNPIKSAFTLVEEKLSSDAAKYSISEGSYAKSVERVEKTLLNYPTEPIDNTIKSMSKRIS